MKPYPMELREDAIRQVELGELSQQEIADVFGISLSCLEKLIRRFRETGDVTPDRIGRPPGTGSIPLDRLAAFIAEHPDATLVETKQGCGLRESITGIWKALKRLGLSRKKKVVHASEQDRPDVQKKRRHWRKLSRTLSAQCLIFIDQTAISTRLDRDHGRAPVGERIVGSVPEKQFETSTLMAALHWDGSVESLVYHGATDTGMALAFVETQLVPALKPGDIVVWDNLKPHRSPTVIQAIEATGARVCPLPPYSPDMNPIEKLWSKLKTLLRGIAARTQEALIEGLDRALGKLTPQDVQHWYKHCGYPSY